MDSRTDKLRQRWSNFYGQALRMQGTIQHHNIQSSRQPSNFVLNVWSLTYWGRPSLARGTVLCHGYLGWVIWTVQTISGHVVDWVDPFLVCDWTSGKLVSHVYLHFEQSLPFPYRSSEWSLEDGKAATVGPVARLIHHNGQAFRSPPRRLQFSPPVLRGQEITDGQIDRASTSAWQINSTRNFDGKPPESLRLKTSIRHIAGDSKIISFTHGQFCESGWFIFVAISFLFI